MVDEITIRGVTHTLSVDTFKNVTDASVFSPYEFNEAEECESISLGDRYEVHIKLYPVGHENICSEDDPRFAVRLGLTIKRDPSGCGKSGKTWIESSVIGVPFEGRMVQIDRSSPYTRGLVERGMWQDLGSPSSVSKFKTIEFRIALKTNKTRIASAEATEHWKQLQRMYKNSKKYGDITLRVITAQDDLTQPPRKKRKFTRNQVLGIGESQDITVKTSSIALRSASNVFESMLNTKMKESEEGVIEIHAESAKDVDDMLYYIMVQDLRQDVTPLSLIKLAHLYQLTTLFDACSARITQNLSVSNFIESVNTFNRYEIEDGYEELVHHGRKHINQLRTLPEFKDLHFSFKYGLLKSQMILR